MNDFKPIEIEDKHFFNHVLREDFPQISELTFTNLFIWRHAYHPVWLERQGCIIIVFRLENKPPFGLQPIGGGNKREALAYLCRRLKQESADVKVCRVSEDFVEHHVDPELYETRIDRDNSDYVYRSENLIQLPGRKYHRKKNHVNRFLKSHTFEYRPLDMELVECFLDMQENWCRMRECVEAPGLLSEDYAVHQALTHFEALDYQGGAVQIGERLEAFALGEPLNPETAVIHIEKANPEIPGLYAAINQLFCRHAFSDTLYINREQDLGEEGLRKAKESYYPHRMIHKYTVIPR